MARYKDIRAEVQWMVDFLYVLHDATDPQTGEASEDDKLLHAQRAISAWWLIYARLMQWAQSHLIGYEMVRLNPACREVLMRLRGKELNDDSHELELLGSLFGANRPEYSKTASPADRGRTASLHPDGGLDELAYELNKASVGLDDATLRRVIVRLLLSTSRESSAWRDPLMDALRALDYGEVYDFFKPSRRRRRGKSYKLNHTRSQAIMHVYYLVGKGLKKYKAQEKVGSAVGFSVETLRTWEKELRKDDRFAFFWQTAMTAGRIEDGPDDAVEHLPVRSHDGMFTNIEMAAPLLRRLHGEYSLSRIKKELQKYHK